MVGVYSQIKGMDRHGERVFDCQRYRLYFCLVIPFTLQLRQRISLSYVSIRSIELTNRYTHYDRFDNKNYGSRLNILLLLRILRSITGDAQGYRLAYR